MSIMKNINKAKVMVLKDQVSYQEGQIVSKTLVQNESVSITLFAFDKGEEISTHESGGDAFVTCLDGTGEITIDGVKYELHEGESIVMPAKHPHAVYGKEQYPSMDQYRIFLSAGEADGAVPLASGARLPAGRIKGGVCDRRDTAGGDGAHRSPGRP